MTSDQELDHWERRSRGEIEVEVEEDFYIRAAPGRDLWAELASRDNALWSKLKRMNNLSPVEIKMICSHHLIYSWAPPDMGGSPYEFLQCLAGYSIRKAKVSDPETSEQPRPESKPLGISRYKPKKASVG